MNYEELYEALQNAEKKLKETSNQSVKMYKSILKNTENGDLAELKKNLQTLGEATSVQKEAATALSELVNAFDTKKYIMDGDFTRQMLECCEEADVNVRGENGVYEMFPFKLRIVGDDDHAEEIYLNRKKLPSFRPKAVVSTIKAAQEKLNKASFNAAAFAGELADAYDTTVMKSGLRPGSNLGLIKIHKALTPMARARKEYDIQAFAYDVARLYNLGPDAWYTKTGRRFEFGTGREGSGSVRVLNAAGIETFVNTIKFFDTEE